MTTRHPCALVLSCIVSLALTITARGAPEAPPPQASADTGEVDAATKQLMAAHGLFQRGLFHHAAQAYADFLSDHASHPQRTAAMYALSICEYRQGEYDKAAPLLSATLRDSQFAQRDEALAVLGHCQWQLK